jgi:K+-transporting ATPase ATPase C chain
VLAAICGLVFPFVLLGVAHVVFPKQADGSLVRDAQGRVVGSRLIGQQFTEAKYFHPRPSAAGAGYDAASSSGLNLGQTNPNLAQTLDERARDYRRENGLAEGFTLPADAVTTSASGLDPDISPANANLQVARVAAARGLRESDVRALVEKHTKGRFLGFFGEPRVNVLELNLALDAVSK